MTDFLANSSHRLFQRPGLGLLRCILLGVTLLALSSGCQNEQDSDATYEEAPRPQQLVQHFQFHRDIKPILEQKICDQGTIRECLQHEQKLTKP